MLGRGCTDSDDDSSAVTPECRVQEISYSGDSDRVGRLGELTIAHWGKKYVLRRNDEKKVTEVGK